jgi:hypothetical protein
MTPESQQEYIITEAQLQAFSFVLGGLSKNNRLLKEIRDRPLTKTSSSITTANDMDHRKSRLGPDGSTGAQVREESRHVGGNCDGYVIHPKKDCFGRYQGVGDDRCFSCDDWGYCADVTEAARTMTLTKTPDCKKYMEYRAHSGHLFVLLYHLTGREWKDEELPEALEAVLEPPKINMHPCTGCGCMLDDNLGCPEMKNCLDYHPCKVAHVATLAAYREADERGERTWRQCNSRLRPGKGTTSGTGTERIPAADHQHRR